MYILMIIINLQYQSITLSLMIIVQIITTAIGTDDGENQEKTFFSKLSNTITKLLIPTKIGINGMLISIKRNNVLKAYEVYLINKTHHS